MKARTIAWTFVMCLVGLTFAFADNPQLGTWKLNETKSKLPPGMPKNSTVVYEAAGDQVKITIDGVDAKGSPTHSEWTGKFDGKEYPVSGDVTSDMRSYKKINDHTLEFVAKKGDKTTLSGKITVTADGKTRSVTATGTGPDGKKVAGTVVYDKQ
jgi:hypothetical protein